MVTKKWSCLVAALSLIACATSIHAATSSGLLIKNIKQTPEGVLLGFTTAPAGCSTSYQGSHAIVKTANPGQGAILAVLVERRATAKPVTLIYDTAGSCDKQETLLVVTGAK